MRTTEILSQSCGQKQIPPLRCGMTTKRTGRHPAGRVGLRDSLFRDGEGDFEGAEFAGGGVEDADAEEELAGGQVELLGELVGALDELPVLGAGERSEERRV